MRKAKGTYSTIGDFRRGKHVIDIGRILQLPGMEVPSERNAVKFDEGNTISLGAIMELINRVSVTQRKNLIPMVLDGMKWSEVTELVNKMKDGRENVLIKERAYSEKMHFETKDGCTCPIRNAGSRLKYNTTTEKKRVTCKVCIKEFTNE